MNSMKLRKAIQMTQTAPLSASDLGMSARHRTFVRMDAAFAPVQGTTVSAALTAGIQIAGIQTAVITTDGHIGLAKSYFPGTSAWSPPTC